MKTSHAVVAGLLLAASSALAAPVEKLTWCETMVTGQGEAERARGLAQCLPEVLVKVSGDPRLAADPRVEPLAARAGEFVASLEYEDRMKALPVGDEQGTRDRPFFLRPTFDAAKIDTLLGELGTTAWGADRPVVAVIAVAHRDGDTWIVARGIKGVTRGAQVEALDAAGRRFGVPIALPQVDRLDALGLTPAAPPPAAIIKALGADALLVGDMTWDEARLGWRTDWRMVNDQATKSWSVEGVSFDDAFRAGVGGAARILSGHGAPM
ncbi:DUF2066 domain-containing protein [Oleomonas cavernae]|uniref:DUF2066 domain-containing protein n=1 Tax=Oleomonas cavernae TaxID=2320859 RepID=A0A418VU16_9PROT|nr:DUF2066 domain-containing protein [Oleomonas cavernae]RJF80641.1 DUF2066 domain-containing protein [Oleomonas cavernae]